MTDLARSALGVFGRYAGRSLLTVLGLAIGVAAFIAMVAFGEGARRSVVAQFELLGADILKVVSVDGVRGARGRPPRPLTDVDVAAVRRDAPSAAAVIPVARRALEVGHGGASRRSMLYGTTPEFAAAHDWRATDGGMFDDADVAGRARVCVLGATPARDLFGGGDPLGRTITLGATATCRVVGVLSPKGHSTAGTDLDDVVLMPVSAYGAQFGRGYAYLEVEPGAPRLLDAARDEVERALRQTHGVGAQEADDFAVSSPREVARAADRTSRILGGLLQGIAAVSLLVGGIGVMNIQLVSVAERTREIGVRAAIGASPRQIMAQFLAEALALSLAGAALGVALGAGAAAVVARWMAWPRVISPSGVLFSALFGIGTGLLFGWLPARRAAALDPIEALRRE